ncbi:MAG: LLM class F420-dependent oxidoreductase [Gammaproteobacteria bacterium]|nr:LLM class F420-dependent oxidoreductase [Gammaproteobacteria bacterium]
MKFGLSLFVTDQSARPDEVAAAVEAAGFESFWVSEHSHIPTATEWPFGGQVPRDYSSMLDPFIALTAAAMATRSIRLGTAICLITQRDPVNCAKSVASLDLLSNGRFELGIGAGWNEAELRNHRTAPETRFRLMRERVEAMRALWTHDVAEYHGRLVDISPSWQWPKPVQKNGPPVHVAGGGPNVLQRVVDYGDGWMPSVVPAEVPGMKGRVTPLSELKTMVPALRALAEKQGKASPQIVITGLTLDADVYRALLNLGADRMILRLPPATMREISTTIEVHAAAIRAVGGSLDGTG